MPEKMKEALNAEIESHVNPDHYKNHTSLECIEEMEIIFGTRGVIYFCVCNAWKYIRRWKNKNGLEDLEKANWYVDKADDLIGSGYSAPDMLKLTDIIYNIRNYIEINNCNKKDVQILDTGRGKLYMNMEDGDK